MNSKTVLMVAAALLVGLAGGYWLSGHHGGEPGQQVAQEKQAEKKPLFYRNPMNPAITSPVPAKDEMGMDYIPVYADGGKDAAAPAGTVSIDPVTEQDIGVRTATVTRMDLAREIRSVGRITYDEERVARLHPKVDGWVEKMFVDKTGEHVQQNSMLLALYSPQLVASAEEYVLALNNYDTLKRSPFPDIRDGAKRLVRSARERLELLDVPAHQMRDIERTRKVTRALHIHSPFDGTVMHIGVREGSRITPDTELYMIADLSRIWVLVDVYEDELPWVKVGDMAEMRVAAVPGRTYRGKVTYIYPFLEAKTRTVKVRLEFDNRDLALKPDMFANITLHASPRHNVIAVPNEAIVRTGTGEQVFVVRAPGKFEPRSITTGVASDSDTEVRSGLETGEKIVTSSQFLIDSESKLKEATAKMLEPKAPPADASMDMSGASLEDPSAGLPNGTVPVRPQGEEQAAPNQQPAAPAPDDMDMSSMQMEEKK